MIKRRNKGKSKGGSKQGRSPLFILKIRFKDSFWKGSGAEWKIQRKNANSRSSVKTDQ